VKTKALQITAAMIAILVTAIGLVLINANSSAATSTANLASTLGQAEKGQPVLDLPYAPECGPDWTLVPTPTVGPPEDRAVDLSCYDNALGRERVECGAKSHYGE
jgi:hypothetical protein